MGASPLTINTTIDQSVSDDGAYFEELPIALGAWRLNAGTVIPAAGAGVVGMAAAATSLLAIQWDDTADQTDIIRLDIPVPNQFAIQRNGGAGRNAQPKLILRVKARVLDGTGSATANADLALTCQAFWHKDSATALSTLGTAISNVIGAADYAAASEEGFVWYNFDITGAMTAAQLAALDGSESFGIQLYPNEAVGTDLYIEVVSTKIKYLRHATLRTTAMRA